MKARSAWRIARRTGLWTAIGVFSIWLVAIFEYNPWRHRRLRAAIVPGASWHAALVSAEAAAFPSGERFDALCMAGDGAAAAFTRASAHDYRLVEYGIVVGSGTRNANRIQTSDLRFNGRARWADAVADLGERLRCKQVLLLFPPTDVLQVEVEADGKRVRVATPSGY